MLEMPTDANPVVVVEGDCRNVLRSLADSSVDVVVTDPPYQSLDVEVGTGTTTRLVRRDVCGGKPLAAADGPRWFDTLTDDEIRGVLSECDRVVKPDGAVYVFADVKSGLRLFADWARNVIVWDKGKIGMGYAWRRMHEWIGYRPKPRHKLRDLTLGDIIRVPGVLEKGHPTEKPFRVLSPILLNSSDPGAVVLDPFAGSGSVGVAALTTGRRAILIEKDPAHAATCRRRVAEAMGLGKGSLLAAAPGLLDGFDTEAA